MKTLVISGKTYQLPNWVVENNAVAKDFYQVLNVEEVISGQDDFDRLGNDYLDSECFSAFALAKGINEDDVLISEVAQSMFAWVTDYDEEDHTLVYLQEI